MSTPAPPLTPTALAEELGISLPYASQLLSGARPMSLAWGLRIYRRTGHQLGPIKDATRAELDVLERYAGDPTAAGSAEDASTAEARP